MKSFDQQLAAVALVIASFLIVTGCDQLGIEKPSVAAGKGAPAFDHAGVTDGCAECHEKERPAPVGDIIHGEGKDCFNCHSFNRDKGWLTLTSFNHVPTPESCIKCHETVRPKLPHIQETDCVKCHSYDDWKKASFNHTPTPESCLECHEVDRPKPPHKPAGDCLLCHTNPDWTKIKPYNHDPLPATCSECHGNERPAAPHVDKGECSGCHKFPDWKDAVSFNHYEPAPTSCNSCHSGIRPASPHPTDGDCIGCHSFPDFTKAKFAHDPKPATCEGYCHVRPTAVYSRAYPNQGPPAGFAAGGAGSGHLVGKDCAACHQTPKEGSKTWVFDHSKPALTFCLPCHYNQGLSKHGTTAPTVYELKDFGNCNNCHKNGDKANQRNWDTGG